MADTQSKIEKRREEAKQRKELNRKRENAKIKHSTVQRIKAIAVTVVVVILLGAIILPSVGITKRLITAVTIGDTKISTAEYSYYYRTSFENYYSTMVSYLGYSPIDTTTSLDKQQMSEDQTYADYFSESAIERLKEVVIWSEAAEAEGFEMSEGLRHELDELMAQVEKVAEGNNVRIDAYIANTYGTGFNRSLFEESSMRELLAGSFKEAKYASFEYTEDELSAYYEEHEDDFMKVDIRVESFGTADASETSDGITIEQAKEFAEEFIADIDSEEEFSEAVIARAEESAAEGEVVTDDSLASDVNYTGVAALDANLADWAFSDDVKEGDVAVIESADGLNYYAAYMVSTKEKDTTSTIDVRHILISVDDTTDTTAMEEAKAKAEELLAQWKAEGSTVEAFEALVAENSNDTGSVSNGGLYEAVKPGEMAEAFDAWCFDESRKAGDAEVVETEYGYHVMYFVGENDTEVWEAEVDDAMRQADYDAYYAEISANVEVETHWLGMLLRNEPY